MRHMKKNKTKLKWSLTALLFISVLCISTLPLRMPAEAVRKIPEPTSSW